MCCIDVDDITGRVGATEVFRRPSGVFEGFQGPPEVFEGFRRLGVAWGRVGSRGGRVGATEGFRRPSGASDVWGAISIITIILISIIMTASIIPIISSFVNQ